MDAGLTQTTQLNTTQLDTGSLAIAPFEAPEGYGAAGPIPPDEEALLRSRSSDQILEVLCSDEEPTEVYWDLPSGPVAPDDQIMVLSDVSGDNLNCSHVNDVADSVVEIILDEDCSANDLLPEWD